MKRNKVMVYLTNYPPNRYVGGELMTADLLEYLVGHGFEVTVFADKVGDTYKRNGVTVRNSGYIATHVVKEFDVFVTHPEIRANVWHYTHDMPYVAIVHNLRPETIRSLNREAPYMTVTNSTWTATNIPEAAQTNGLGAQVIKPPVLLKPVDKWHPTYITQINLSYDKGVDIFAHLAARNPSHDFMGVKGGYSDQRVGFTDNVMVVEHTDDINHVYNRTKVLVVPSRHETYGKVVTEAMAWGIPVIASDLPGIREAGGDAVLYCDPTDYTAWHDTLHTVLTDPQTYDDLSLKSRDRASHLEEQTHHDLAMWHGLMQYVVAHA